jgi:general secretion pathway protein G
MDIKADQVAQSKVGAVAHFDVGGNMAIGSPRYFHSTNRARESSLHTSRATLRDAIDKFDGDLGRHPESLEELTQRQYIREVPLDPITGRRDTWVVSPPPSDAEAVGHERDGRSVCAESKAELVVLCMQPRGLGVALGARVRG